MFISLSKTIGKVGGFRIGVGKRITSKNAWYMALIVAFVCCFQLVFYMMIGMCWCIYAMFYGIFWCFKMMVVCIARLCGKGKPSGVATSNAAMKQLQSNTYGNQNMANQVPINNGIIQQNPVNVVRRCPSCGAEVKEGNGFCTVCGNKVL